MAEKLLGIATDDDAPYAVKLAAIKDALDRAGVSAKTAVEVEVNLKPWEKVFESISRDGGDDGAYERVLAMAEAAEPDVPDTVVIYELDTPDPGATGPQEPHTYPPDAHTAEPAGRPGVPGTPRALSAGASDAVTGDDAVARAAELNRRGAFLPVLYEDPAPHNPRGRR
ncbi:hypothetical protein ATM97_24325 [Nocardia sp. MH4]|uniref:hypothetical protein n=1 Tax=Nocardia sp. MH4 TaxID=1768677 RepID=UPI001C4F3DB1|nr:hypothetical protein [Nocardia sp. MH4]MBW0273213.1 hypothetical protein [Nocardia sp. MH4]